MMGGHRDKPAQSGEEYDGTSRNWRRILHSRPGRWHAVKRALSRRARRRAACKALEQTRDELGY